MLLSIAVVAALNATPTPDQLRNVEVLLSPIEEGPRYVAIRHLPYARQGFELIAKDSTLPMVIRARALEGIASYRDDAAFARVSAAVDDTSLPVIVRREALLGLGIQFQARALAVVERVLKTQEDVQFRRIAAITLSRIRTPESMQLAKNAQFTEKNEVVQGDIAKSIVALEKPAFHRPTPVRPPRVVAPRK